MHIGQTLTHQRVFTQSDFDRFARLSGDDNPIHVDPDFAARTKFGRTVAHGMFLYSNICAMLGTQLPGAGTVQISQELMFPTPTYVGEAVALALEVTALDGDTAHLTTTVRRPNGDIGLQGSTRVWLPQATRHVLSTDTYAPPSGPALGAAHKGLAFGQQAEMWRTFTAEDVAEYVALVGDTNPIYMDAVAAQSVGFAQTIIPGGLLGGMFSYLLGTSLPGRGTNWLKQKLAFPMPAYPGQAIMARVEIIRIRPEKDLVTLHTVGLNPAGEVVCEGEALVWVGDLEG